MFDTIQSGMMAYQQILMLVGGFICLSLGVLLGGNEIYWRLKSVRVAGIVAGVRQKGNAFYPVYRYQMPSGETQEATSDIGSAGLEGKETGRMIPLLVFPDTPNEARAASTWAFGAVGVLMMFPAAWLIYAAFTRYPVTQMTCFFAIALFCYCGMKLHRILFAKSGRVSLKGWKAAMRQQHEAAMRDVPVVRIEDLVPHDVAQKMVTQKAKNRRIAGPLMLIGAAFMIWGGLYIGNALADLLRDGASAKGQVVAMQSLPSAPNDYYAVVAFNDAGGKPHQFQDNMSSNPPEFRAGDAVTVLYLPNDPDPRAMIDRGAMDYVGPLALLLFGTLFGILGGVMTMRNRRQQAEKPPETP
jgi:hypothetical protein